MSGKRIVLGLKILHLLFSARHAIHNDEQIHKNPSDLLDDYFISVVSSPFDIRYCLAR